MNDHYDLPPTRGDYPIRNPDRLERVGRVLRRWLREIEGFVGHGAVWDTAWITEDGKIQVAIHTREAEYAISAAHGYLGCIAHCRYWRPGERHHRGNDLPDGGFCRETWDRILRAIVAFEIRPGLGEPS